MASDHMSLISFFVATILMGFVYRSTHSAEYSVGGKYGWALRPSKTYNQWAARNRFQVSDSLIFKYKNGTDSVLVVDQDDYDTCNKAKPIRSLDNEGEYSKIKFYHAGPFFFISGYAHNCEKGQKIVILVMNPRGTGDTPQSPSPAPSPLPNSPAPAPSPTPSPATISSEEAKSGAAAFGVRGGVTLVNLLFGLVSIYIALLGGIN